jgi:hypothetical protein
MGAAACLQNPVTTSRLQPLVLRYLLHAHNGPLDPARAAGVGEQFAALTPYQVGRATVKHTRNAVSRKPAP